MERAAWTFVCFFLSEICFISLILPVFFSVALDDDLADWQLIEDIRVRK